MAVFGWTLWYACRLCALGFAGFWSRVAVVASGHALPSGSIYAPWVSFPRNHLSAHPLDMYSCFWTCCLRGPCVSYGPAISFLPSRGQALGLRSILPPPTALSTVNPRYTFASVAPPFVLLLSVLSPLIILAYLFLSPPHTDGRAGGLPFILSPTLGTGGRLSLFTSSLCYLCTFAVVA